MSSKTAKLLEQVFRDPGIRHGLRFFSNGEIEKLRLRELDDKIDIFCAKREKWMRAKPEEIVRQLFLVWVRENLKYPLSRVAVEWPIQMGHDEEKERADIVVFSDDALTDPYIVFEVKRPDSKDGLAQLQSYLRWTGCFFGCWSNGDDYTYQLREEDDDSKKGPYKFRDMARLPRHGEELSDILQPLRFNQLAPIPNMRGLIERLEHDALSNAGVNAFDELFKLLFAKLHDEYRPGRRDGDEVEFRVPISTPEAVYTRLDKLFQAAKRRSNWQNIFDEGDHLKLRGDALKLCASALERFSLRSTDLDAVDAAFEHLINPEQKGSKGQYFTPRPVVKMAIKMLNPQDGEKMIDPACGSCGFLIHAIRHVQRLYGWRQSELYRYANDYLYAVDFDERLKKVAKTMMIIAGDGKANVFGVNTLDVREWQNSEVSRRVGPFARDITDGDFDIIATNPPFAGKITGKTQLSVYELYQLAVSGVLQEEDEDDETDDAVDEAVAEGMAKEPRRTKRKVAGMRRDILFVERCLDMLKPGGRMAIVLPQGNLNNIGTAGLRSWMADRARILAVVGLSVNTFKRFTGTKTSIVFLQKWGGAAGPPRSDYSIFLATSQKSGKDNSGRYVYRKNAFGAIVDEDNEPTAYTLKLPAIDHDLDEIADAFLKWGRRQRLGFLA